MPTSQNTNLKAFKLSLAFLFLPLFFFGQSLTGLYTGVLTNDSNSVRKDQSFEIALTEYKGKVYGYSRSEFIVDNVLYYILKRVKGTINGDVCEVKDDEIISYNFPTKLDKGVKVISTFYRNKNDSTWYLAGSWKTNQTRNYYSLTGKVDLKEEKDLTNSKLFPHLEELSLANDVPFYKDRIKETRPVLVRTAVPENKKNDELIKRAEQPIVKQSTPTVLPVKAPPVATTNTDTKKPATVSEPTSTAVTEKKDPSTLPNGMRTQTMTEAETRAFTKATPPPVTKDQPVAKTDIKNTNTTKTPVTTTPVTETAKNNNTITEKKDIVKNNNPAPVFQTDQSLKKPAAPAVIAGRKSELAQVVNYKSDSLELALYDNGEIDGDTVSVFVDGKVIFDKQGLKASAIRKTIYITPGNEDFTLVLFAETLGKYPPNTGLLVVHDGDDTYNIRFSADLQKNAGVVFKRVKK